jgi:predicted nucleotide-binding protein
MMRSGTTARLQKLVDEGAEINNPHHLQNWYLKTLAFLEVSLGVSERVRFSRLGASSDWETHALRLGHLEGLMAKEGTQTETAAIGLTSGASHPIHESAHGSDSVKVFVVHGHDNAAKEGTARFLEKIGLQPIILHEQPSSGRTIIEKFETYSGDIAFAVVLLTPDDVGAASAESSSLRKRARQNVIMELGYFMGRLGRNRVCALHKGGVELPSDYQGVLYIEMDEAGAWKSKLAQEFVQAKLLINLAGLLT